MDQPQNTPNLYQLHGGGLHVGYASSSLDGQPHFDYADSHANRHFVGDEIRTEQTEVGLLVSVSLQRTIDSGSTSFSLLVPNVNLASAQSSPIHTIAITTHHRFSIIHALNLGQTELYHVTHLTGTAQAVVF